MSKITRLDRGDAALSRDDKVNRWQLEVDLPQEPQDDGNAIIKRLYESGHDLYEAFIQNFLTEQSLARPLYRQLHSTYTRYLVWAHDYNILDGKLDGLLQTSQRLRATVIGILVNICTTLHRGLCSSSYNLKSFN